MCTVSLYSHTNVSRTLFHNVNMHFKVLLFLFSLLVTIWNIYAWTWAGPETINGKGYSLYEGFPIAYPSYCDVDCKRKFCEVATTGENPLYSINDVVQGDFPEEMIDIGDGEQRATIKCVDQYKDNKQLYIGTGPEFYSISVYEKLQDGTAVLAGFMKNTPQDLEEVPSAEQTYINP